MRDDKQLEGFLFVSFIALQFYYRIYGKLIEKELLNYYSVSDIIVYLKRVHLLKIRGKTQLAEIPKKKSRKHTEKLEYVLPEEPTIKNRDHLKKRKTFYSGDNKGLISSLLRRREAKRKKVKGEIK
ncbi:MAG: hypothetical protein WBB08_06095 [Halobacteriota archaeon]